MELTSVWEGVGLPGPVEHRVILKNRESRQAFLFSPPPTIAVGLAVHADSILEHWWVEKGARRPSDKGVHTGAIHPGYSKLLFSGPHSSDKQDRDAIPWLSVHDGKEKRGVYCGVEFSGWCRMDVRRPSTESITLSMGLDDRDGLAKLRIQPGESLELPTCFLGVYKGEVDDGCNRLHRWVEKHLRPPVPGGVTPLLVNNSWGSGMDVDEELARRMIDDCAELGIEVYHIDAGWYSEVGDWRPNPDKFPNGIRAIADYAHSKGLKFGLWVAWTQGVPYEEQVRKYLAFSAQV